jgi:hypothetical protein
MWTSPSRSSSSMMSANGRDTDGQQHRERERQQPCTAGPLTERRRAKGLRAPLLLQAGAVTDGTEKLQGLRALLLLRAGARALGPAAADAGCSAQPCTVS